MRPAYSVRITPADVGRRVSVRARSNAGAGQPSTTDTVGRLLAWDPDSLLIERRDGSQARVAVRDLVAAKVIPERPPRAPAR